MVGAGRYSKARSYKKRATRKTRVPRLTSAMKGYYRRVGNYDTGEVKYFDSNHTNAVIVNTGAIKSSINFVGQGVEQDQRIGRKLWVKSVDFRGRWELPATATVADTTDRYKLVVFLDRQCNGAAATVADIYETSGTQVLFNAFKIKSNQQRFKVLKEVQGVLTSQCGGSGLKADDTTLISSFGEQKRYFDFHVRCGFPIEMSGTGASPGISQVKSNNIFVYMITTGGLAKCGFTARLNFTDK